MFIGTADAIPIRFHTSDAEKMRLDASGRLGIGTTSPSKELDVVGTIKATGADNSNTMELFGGTTTNQSFGLLVDAGTSAADYAARFRKSDNTVIMEVSGTGNVGIGTISPSTPLHVYSNTSGVIATISGPNDYNSETGISLAVDRAKISGVLNGSGGTPGASLRFYTQPDSGSLTERMRIKSDGQITTQGDILPGADVIMANGRGISFAATANSSGSMSSELLDDYEEGTWTPVVKLGTTTVTSTNTGFYTKIGRIITLQVQCGFSNLNSGTGNLTIEGIPFNSADVAHRNHGSVGYYNVASSFGANGVQARISRNSTFIDFMRSHEISPAQHGHMQSNSELYITITYKNE
jgi:hypothetical protein